MAISDHKQRVMPTPLDRARGKPLAYPEAVLLTDPSNPQLKGEVIRILEFGITSKMTLVLKEFHNAANYMSFIVGIMGLLILR